MPNCHAPPVDNLNPGPGRRPDLMTCRSMLYNVQFICLATQLLEHIMSMLVPAYGLLFDCVMTTVRIITDAEHSLTLGTQSSTSVFLSDHTLYSASGRTGQAISCSLPL